MLSTAWRPAQPAAGPPDRRPGLPAGPAEPVAGAWAEQRDRGRPLGRGVAGLAGSSAR